MNVKSIIQEEINSFLNEMREFRDDEIIDKNQISLQNEYDKLNVLLFNNELPKVPLVWNNRKRALGHVRSMQNRITGEVKIINLAMTSFYNTTYRSFKDTLAHEMIHVELLSNGEFRKQSDPHGYLFIREADRINSMGLGFNITKENTEELNVSNQTKANARDLIGIIINLDGKYFIAATTPGTYAVESDNLFRFFKYSVRSGRHRNVELTIVETKNPELLKFPIQRSFKRSMSYTPLSDKLFEELLNDNVIKSVKINKDTIDQITEQNQGDWVEVDIV
jgi:hypothetical protein